MNRKMMMKKYLLFIMVLSFALQACYDDKTTNDINKISEIEIDFGVYEMETIEIDKNETLTIDPIIKQTNKEKSLEYEWEINQEIYSTEKVLNYEGSRLGTFRARLRAFNEDGSTYKVFNIRVNSPYEEGLLILSLDEARNSSLGFIKKIPNMDIDKTPIEDVQSEAFKLNNEGASLGKGISDIAKRAKQFFISSEDDGSITIINDQTLEMEAQITAQEFPNFKPTILNIPDNTAVSAIVMTRDGKLFNLATKEHILLENNTLGASVNLLVKSQFIPGLNYTSNYFWDLNASRLWNVTPYGNSSSKDELIGHEFYTFFEANSKTYILTKQPNSSSFTKNVYSVTHSAFTNLEKETFTTTGVVPTESSVTLLDEKLFKLLHADGNKVYQWYYSGTDFNEPPLLTIDVEGEITYLAKNNNGKELFVGVYNQNASGKKGSVLIYNIETGRKLGQFIGITDKPVKLLYKNKS